ncbi:MAG TPA: CDP-alcohol phosphatidyltransferase family protein [Vicinamibacteria bacterium]|nr:CDP-alcohol phosphatidyltransferase family protein [Vicinamibacteria bacterium]
MELTKAAGEEPVFREARRELAGLTAAREKQVLAWLAARLPAWVAPDHLTALGLGAMALGGAAYAASGRHPGLLWAVNLALVLNWLGDSLDGTLARHRGRLRPRYGFYVDHVSDVFGALFLVGGLAASGHVAPRVAWGLLVVYLLFSVNLYLATHTLGRFKMSYGPVGGTEARLILAAANVLLLAWPTVWLFARPFRLFDVFGVLATGGLAGTLLKSVADTARELYRQERV